MSQDHSATPRKREPFPPMPVSVSVSDLNTGIVDAEHHFDFNKIEKRKWFVERLLVWAMLNGRKVVLTPGAK